LIEINNQFITDFTSEEITPPNPFCIEFENSFKLKSHKSNIFKTPEKDDYILAGSQNVSPTTKFLKINEYSKSKADQNQEFLRRTNEVFRQQKLKNDQKGKILIRLDFGKRDLISSLFGYPSHI